MSLFGLFDIGKSAIFASQAALNVTSHNIANANTPGFSRQEIILDIASPISLGRGYLGRGVTLGGVRRHYDKFIQAQLLGQRQNYGRSLALEQSLSQIEQVFNEAGGLGIGKPLSDFFNSWQEVATNPEDKAQRTALLEKAKTLVLVTKKMEDSISDTQAQINKDIENITGEINSLAGEIAELNSKIVFMEAGSTKIANDLRDMRENLLNELSELVEFTHYENQDGSINVVVGMRNLVYGESTNALQINMNNDLNNDLYLEDINITSMINKGKLGGMIAARSDIESDSLKDLRKLIASLTKEINLMHRAGYGLDASTGNNFFNSLSLSIADYSSGASVTSSSIANLSALTLQEYEVTFDAVNYYVKDADTGSTVTSGAYVSGNTISFDGIDIAITGTVSSADTFFISPLTNSINNFGVAISDSNKVAAASSNTALPGDNTNALSIAGLFNTAIGNLGNLTFTDFYGGIVSTAGTMSGAAADSLSFDNTLLKELTIKQASVSSVSLDEEAMNLIRFQRAFEAGARLIKVTDELLETIINI